MHRKSNRRLQQIEKTVARLFASKGYHSTSMRDIARELGMTQASLYYYFKSKEDILFKLMNDAMDDALEAMEQICAAHLPAEEKLIRVLNFYTRYYAGDQDREILLLNEMNSLAESSRRILIEKQRRYVQLFYEMLDELRSLGQLKDIHPSVATFAFFGMVHYTVKWYRRDGPVKLDQLADMFVQIFTRGILI